MRSLILALLAFLAAVGTSAEGVKGSRSVVLDRERFGDSSGTRAEYCLGSPGAFDSGMGCTLKQTLPFPGKDSPISIPVHVICSNLLSNDRTVSPARVWLLASLEHPAQPVPAYQLDCARNRAFPILAAEAPDPQSSISALIPERHPGGDELNQRIANIEGRIVDLERRPPESDQLKELGKEQQRLGRELEKLRQELERRLDELEEASRTSCLKSEGIYNGRPEVMVAVAGHVLRFVAVEPSGPVGIGLSEEKATELQREVQSQSNDAIVPWIFRSVPEVHREVGRFLLQDRLIDPRLYSQLIGGSDAGQVSYEEVSRFLAELNQRCRNTARFELPSEEQFVAAAKQVYDPARNGLIPCAALKSHGSALGLSQLLGYSWQLTRSLCEPLGAETPEACPEGSYVRKGGTSSSTNPLECMPEYRSAAPPSVAQKQTSFRLVLTE